MKYVVICALGLAMALASCVRKKVVEEVSGQRDSLAVVVGQKDSLIDAVFAEIGSIADNLGRIRTREQLIALPESDEGVQRPSTQIRADIAAIDCLLEQNRAKIASLQRAAAQLRKANVRIDGLEKMISGLDAQLAGKRVEVDSLRGRLARKQLEVDNLVEEVAVQRSTVSMLNDEKDELENRLHTIYYIVGSERELRDAQIVDKRGLIGRTLRQDGRNLALESFTLGDSRLLKEIPVGQRRAQVVSSHPQGSYELVVNQNRVVEKLVITDPERFWESSKVLIVSYK